MPKTSGYRCPVRGNYCKKVLVSKAEARRRCTGTVRSVKDAEGVLRTYCRTRAAGPRGGRTLLLSIRKPKSRLRRRGR